MRLAACASEFYRLSGLGIGPTLELSVVLELAVF